MYFSAKDASKYYNVSESTLRSWANKQQITFIRTPGGHRRYKIEDENQPRDRITIVYARVSSAKQKGDLKNQIDYIKQHYPSGIIYQDIASGLNFQRKEFRRLVERVIKGEVREVVVSDRDRLSRFGFEFFEWFFQLFNTQITILSDTNRDPHREFIDGLMSIITVYTARYYGSRSKRRNSNVKSPILSN